MLPNEYLAKLFGVHPGQVSDVSISLYQPSVLISFQGETVPLPAECNIQLTLTNTSLKPADFENTVIMVESYSVDLLPYATATVAGQLRPGPEASEIISTFLSQK